MLPRTRRLRSHHDYQRVYQKGESLTLGFFKIKTYPHPLGDETRPSRVGFVISNNVLKSAVQRNKKKRQLRAIFKELAPFLKSGYDVVVTTMPSCRSASYQDMEEDITVGLTKIKFLVNKEC